MSGFAFNFREAVVRVNISGSTRLVLSFTYLSNNKIISSKKRQDLAATSNHPNKSKQTSTGKLLYYRPWKHEMFWHVTLHNCNPCHYHWRHCGESTAIIQYGLLWEVYGTQMTNEEKMCSHFQLYHIWYTNV